MIDEKKLENDILMELSTVISEFKNVENEVTIMNPFSPEKLSKQINQETSYIRSMTYENQKVTGLEAIVKSFSKEIVHHLTTEMTLNDLSDVEITQTVVNGQVLTYQNGYWVNREIQTVTNNYYQIDDEIIIPTHNHGVGLVNRLTKFIDPSGIIGQSSVEETFDSLITTFKLSIGSSLDIFPESDQFSLIRFHPINNIYSGNPMFGVGEFYNGSGTFAIKRSNDGFS
jgi:hypothetical protein